MQKRITTRPSLGRVANLGELFDARREQFLGATIFNGSIPPTCIRSVDNQETKFVQINSKRLSDKLNEFKLDGETKVSLLSGMLGQLEGSIKYVDDSSTQSSKDQQSYLYSLLTKIETLELNHSQLKDFICEKTLSPDSSLTKSATHVVFQIQWGAQMIVNAKSSTESVKSKENLGGGLKGGGKWKKIMLDLQAQVEGNSLSSDANDMSDLSIKFVGDIVPTEGLAIKSMKDLHNIIQAFPGLVSTHNNGKGKPVSYGLVPISDVQQHFELPISFESSWTELDEDISTGMVALFDRISELKKKLDKFQKKITPFEGSLSKDDLKCIENIKISIGKIEICLKDELKVVVIGIRLGQLENLAMMELQKKYGLDNPELKKIMDFLEENGHGIGHKIGIISKLEEDPKIKVIKKGDNLSEFVRQMKTHDGYVLCLGEKATPEDWDEGIDFFKQLQDSLELMGKEAELIVLDGSITNAQLEKVVEVHHYKNKTLSSTDIKTKIQNISIVGEYELVDNGNYGEYLTAIGVGTIYWYAQMKSYSTVKISMSRDERYTIEIITSVGSISNTFHLGEATQDKSADGYDSKTTTIRVLNVMQQIQVLSDASKSRRTTTRIFTENEMMVHLEANGVKAIRRYERVKK